MIKKDTLLLFYDGNFASDLISGYRFLNQSDSLTTPIGSERPISNDEINLKIVTKDTTKKSLSGTTLLFRYFDKLIYTGLTDENGINDLYSQGGLINNVELIQLGYQSVNIDLSELWGKSSSVEVTLIESGNNAYDVISRTEKYLILERNKEILILKKIIDSELYTFKLSR